MRKDFFLTIDDSIKGIPEIATTTVPKLLREMPKFYYEGVLEVYKYNRDVSIPYTWVSN